ncbi:MAG: alpha,alpha-trehalase TreA [Ferruginibacter sp.]
MLSKITMFSMLALMGIHICNAQLPASPDKVYGQLFQDVQLQKIFPDGKTFVDCIPKRNPKDIVADYEKRKGAGLELSKFVEDNFSLPAAMPQLNNIQQEKDLSMHVKNLWSILKRNADSKPLAGSSLLPLPFPYIVPGGRFREVYYWDSYFTMLGLKESGQGAMIENMVKNFAYLINTYGHIPNGNRSYYLSRSQPPYFSLMVELLAGIKGNAVYKTYMPAMEKEYAYWMQGTDKIKNGERLKHLAKLNDGTLLNRYCDEASTPRPESYKEDYEISDAVAKELAMRIKVSSPEALKRVLDTRKAEVNTHLRSSAESGWDFSSRWFADGQNIQSIQTTDIIPVDLNCLLYALEMNIAKAKNLSGLQSAGDVYLQKANKRKAAILKYCWNGQTNFFHDYNAVAQSQTEDITEAGLFPLFVKIATPAQATGVEATTRKSLLKDGGIVTTTKNTGQQWDAPNGWAPLQWISVIGLKNYGKNETARLIATRWLSLNEKVYAATGKMMEKYNVEDLSKEAGGGEYESQDGFGWTNGVYLALKKIYGGK